jgi:hypothetical protein
VSNFYTSSGKAVAAHVPTVTLLNRSNQLKLTSHKENWTTQNCYFQAQLLKPTNSLITSSSINQYVKSRNSIVIWLNKRLRPKISTRMFKSRYHEHRLQTNCIRFTELLLVRKNSRVSLLNGINCTLKVVFWQVRVETNLFEHFKRHLCLVTHKQPCDSLTSPARASRLLFCSGIASLDEWHPHRQPSQLYLAPDLFRD